MKHTLQDKVDALRDPANHRLPVSSVEAIETHFSWVFLAGERAYKLKKPLHQGLQDFSTLERRRHYCREELRVNRRLAPQVYLGLVPLAVLTLKFGQANVQSVTGVADAVASRASWRSRSVA